MNSNRIDKVRIMVELEVVPPYHVEKKELSKYAKNLISSALKNDKLLMTDYNIEFNPVEVLPEKQVLQQVKIVEYERITMKSIDEQNEKTLNDMRRMRLL